MSIIVLVYKLGLNSINLKQASRGCSDEAGVMLCLNLERLL